ncbi:GNAT family N-acetyltransferase [Niveibacterium sp. SC-1]|uniref:GNAT family N-acetyltransferase n=1 Tax=Niveibacterium sp. SC-1 TaxID=3135646 RepID=UPI00311D614B
MRTKPVIRPALRADAVQVADIFLAARARMAYAPLKHSEDEVRAWIALHLVPLGRVTVAEEGASLLGMCAVDTRQGCGWIDQLYLRPGEEGRGVGGLLLRDAMTRLPFPQRLYTFRANTRAANFYRRHGFEAIAYGDGSDNEEGVPDILFECTDRRLGVS